MRHARAVFDVVKYIQVTTAHQSAIVDVVPRSWL